MGASVQFIHKITETDCHSQLFAEFIQTQKRYPNSFRQNKWSNLKTANHIWPKFFLPLWTKLLEKLPLEKYPISVLVTLMESSISKSIGYISYVSYHLSITAGDQWKQERKKQWGKHWLAQYSRRECLDFPGMPNAVPPKGLESFVIHA